MPVFIKQLRITHCTGSWDRHRVTAICLAGQSLPSDLTPCRQSRFSSRVAIAPAVVISRQDGVFGEWPKTNHHTLEVALPTPACLRTAPGSLPPSTPSLLFLRTSTWAFSFQVFYCKVTMGKRVRVTKTRKLEDCHGSGSSCVVFDSFLKRLIDHLTLFWKRLTKTPSTPISVPLSIILCGHLSFMER